MKTIHTDMEELTFIHTFLVVGFDYFGNGTYYERILNIQNHMGINRGR
jgi:hypothetical protein